MNRLLLDPVHYEKDAELLLGMANGNVYNRQPGIKDVHDGQIMVRLKLKRFLVLDYSFEPTSDEINSASNNPHVIIYTGAGKATCNATGCNKIGIPVCLYDSCPDDGTKSLYIRGGQCFSCQRRLNEKRRARKKPSIEGGGENSGGGNGGVKEDTSPCIIYALGPNTKKFKYNSGAIFELKDDAVIVNGSIDGIKSFKQGYSLQEIGSDLYQTSQQASTDAQQLIQRSASITAAAAVAAMGSPTTIDNNNNDDNLVPNNSLPVVHTENGNSSLTSTATTATTNTLTMTNESIEEIMGLYQKAFQSLNMSIFLLSQWKVTWDAANNNPTNKPTPPQIDSIAFDESARSSLRFVTPNSKDIDAAVENEENKMMMKPMSLPILLETGPMNTELSSSDICNGSTLQDGNGVHTNEVPVPPTILSNNDESMEFIPDIPSSSIVQYPEHVDNSVDSRNSVNHNNNDSEYKIVPQPHSISEYSLFGNSYSKKTNEIKVEDNQAFHLYDEV